MKQFKSKKVKKRKRILLFIFVFFFVFSYVFVVKYLKENNLDKNVLSNDVNYVKFNITKYLSDKASKVVNAPVSLLNRSVKNASYIETKRTNLNTKKDDVKKSNQNDSFEPTIYVYSTHESEGYTDYSVLEAASYLTDELNNFGIDTYHEEKSVSTFLQTNSMKYYESYVVSRKYIDEAINNYPSITYFFDIHRDALSKDKSTITINGKSYAKVMFLVGRDNESYEGNLESAKSLNEIINNMVPGISRGVLEKGGKGVNGVYNQDVSKNSFLIEVGGNNNNKQEVINTIDVIVKAIISYTGGMVW